MIPNKLSTLLQKPSEEDDHEDNQLVFEPVAYGYLSVGASFLNGTPISQSDLPGERLRWSRSF